MEDNKVVKYRDRANILKAKDDEIIEIVKNDLALSKKWRDEVNLRNKRYRDCYFQKDIIPAVTKKDAPKEESTTLSQVYVGITRAVVDTAIAVIAGSIFSADRFIKIEPTEVEDEQASIAFEHLLHYRLARSQTNFKAIFKNDWLFQALLYDFAVARIGWTVEGAYVPHKTTFQKLVNIALFRQRKQYQKTSMVWKHDAIDRPDIEVFDTLSAFPDKRSTDFSGAGVSRYFIYLRASNRSHLKNLEKTKDNPFGLYENVDKIEINSYPKGDTTSNIDQIHDKDDHQHDAESDLILLAEYYTPHALVVVANDKWVVRKEKLAGYPLSKMTFIQPNHQWSGIGLVEGIEGLQYDTNELVRMARNSQNYQVNAIPIINEVLFAHRKTQSYKMYPGKTFFTRSGDPSKAIHWERPPDIAQSIPQQVSFNINMVERISSVSENAQGIWRQGGRRTATEAELVSAGTQTRLGEVIREIEDKNIIDVGYMIYNQEQLNLTEAVKLRILGLRGALQFLEISKEHILHKGAFDIRPIGSRYEANRAIRTNQFLQGINAISGNPIFMQLSNAEELLRELWQRLGEKDPARFLQNKEEIDQIVAQIKSRLSVGDMRDLGISPLSKTDTALPTSPENVMGQGFQTAGGMRTPAGGRPPAGAPPPAPPEGGMI